LLRECGAGATGGKCTVPVVISVVAVCRLVAAAAADAATVQCSHTHTHTHTHTHAHKT